MTASAADLYEKGYRVYTTLDVDIQERAVEAMGNGWQTGSSRPGTRHPKYREVGSAEKSRRTTPYLQGMFVALDPATGDVRAMIGGRDFAGLQVQPGDPGPRGSPAPCSSRSSTRRRSPAASRRPT